MLIIIPLFPVAWITFALWLHLTIGDDDNISMFVLKQA